MYAILLEVTRLFLSRIKPGASLFIEVLILLMIYYKCNLLKKFCSNNYNHYFLGVLSRHLVIDESYSQQANQSFLTNYEKAIADILTIIIKECSPHILEWIFVVPLMHFITKQSRPYEILESIQDKSSHHTEK